MSKSIRASIFVLVVLVVHFVVSMTGIYPAGISTYVSTAIVLLSLINVALTLMNTGWRKTPSANE